MKKEYKGYPAGLLSKILIACIIIGFVSLSAYATQPDEVTVDVFRYDINGNEVYSGNYTIKESDGWHLKIPAMSKYDSNGNPYNYVVIEQPIDGYTSAVYQYVNTASSGYYYMVVNQEAHLVTFDGNGGTVLPENEKRTVAPATGTLGLTVTLSSNMPPNPVRGGYTFNGWNTRPDGTGTVFTAATEITGDITVYAQWTVNSTGGGVGKASVGSGASKIISGEDPIINIPDINIPDAIIHPRNEETGQWAIATLISVILGIIFAIVSVICTLLKHKKGMWSMSEKKSKFTWAFIAIIMGIAGVLLLLLTQDIGQKMVLFDIWTIAGAVIFIIETKCLTIALNLKLLNRGK